MKKRIAILPIVVLLCIASCGVKKNATQQESQKTNELVVTNDSLAFLGNLINDSTIHINYAYGIPFIIDDSVPMFLPPIDKNLEGYVSSDKYCTTIDASLGCQAYARNRWNKNKVSACGVDNPLDSLLWLNKCINDLLDFCSFENKVLYPSHYYTYVFNLLSADDQQFIQIAVEQKIAWLYLNSDYPKLSETIINYFLDCEGNLIGKMYAEMPLQIVHPGKEPIPLRTSIPDYQKFEKFYFSTALKKSLGYITLRVIAPGTLNSAEI